MEKEKSVKSFLKKHFFATLPILILAMAAMGQNSFRVGETVETNDGRVCKILSITGRSAKVACGSNRSEIRVYSFDSMMSEQAAQAKRDELEKQKQAAANAPKSQKAIFRAGDTVQTSDGRNGVIESFKDDEMAKVKFADNSTNYFFLTDLKNVSEAAKPTFGVGDKVFHGGKPGVIETIEKNGYKVRFGSGKYDWSHATAENLLTPQQAAAQQQREQQEKIQKPLRAALEDEAKPFMDTIRLLAHSFNPKIGFQGGSLDSTPTVREKWRRDLEALNAVCQKYPNITNSPLADDPIYANDIKYWHSDWCRMAQQPDVAIKNFLKFAGSDQTKYTVNDVQRLLNEAERDSEGYIADELQTVLFDRAAWVKKNTQHLKTQFGLTDQDIETQVFAPLAGKLGELKTRIERDAANVAPTLPKFTDAALAATVKSRVAADYPGAQVLKIGLDSANWSVRDGKEHIASSSNGTQYYLRLKGAYRIRTGRALIRLANQPFCQIRYIELTQPKKGAGFDAAWARVETSGKFVKCP